MTFLKQGPLSSVASRPDVRILLGMSNPTAPRHLPARSLPKPAVGLKLSKPDR